MPFDEYAATRAHAKIRRIRGRADYCVFGCTLRPSGWSIRRFHWANLTGDYDNPDDYAAMCPSCHSRYDGARRSMNDGETTRPRFVLTT